MLLPKRNTAERNRWAPTRKIALAFLQLLHSGYRQVGRFHLISPHVGDTHLQRPRGAMSVITSNKGASMRKFLFASSAIAALVMAAPATAADMPVKARPLPPPPPVFSWTGFYIGAHVGGAWGTTESSLKNVSATFCEFGFCETDSIGGFVIPISQTQTNGFLGGVQGGYNWQVAPWLVLGVEAQFSWTDLQGTSPCVLILACNTNHDWITTLAGRVGFTYDRLMVYFKGGVAWSKADYSASLSLGNNLGQFGNFSTSVSDTRFGAMFGTGIEYAFWGNWSAKIEYNYIRFRNEDYTFPLSFAEGPFSLNLGFDTTIKEHIHLVKAGVNYRFDWGKYPVAVRAAY
jgi:outer membrane immunogenic protein